jgi:hypothetical protein
MVGLSLFGPSGERGAAVAAGVVELAQQHATLVFTATRAVKAFEHPAEVRVALHLITVGGKCNLGTGAKQVLDFFNRAKLGLIHVDHYFLDDQPYLKFAANYGFRLIPHWVIPPISTEPKSRTVMQPWPDAAAYFPINPSWPCSTTYFQVLSRTEINYSAWWSF